MGVANSNQLDKLVEDVAKLQESLPPPTRTREFERFNADITITIALKEEYAAIEQLIHEDPALTSPVKPLRVKGSEHRELYFQRKLPNSEERSLSVMIALVEDMGELDAGLITMNYLHRCEPSPSLLVSLGISGSLDDDFKLCDVVVSDSVLRYMHRSKAIADKEDKEDFDISHGGKEVACPKKCYNFANDFDSDHKKACAAWRDAGKADLSTSVSAGVLAELLKEREVEGKKFPSQIRTSPELKVGKTACGPSVAAAAKFKEWLKKKDRNLRAIDMECSGVVGAFDRSLPEFKPHHMIVIRGISDYSNEGKTELDDASGNAIRAVATRNAYRALWKLIDVGMLSGDGE